MLDGEHFAAVDLGSNSFHMLIVRAVNGRWVVIDRMRERVRLAAGLDADDRLTVEARQRGLACLTRFGRRLASLERVRVRAVGTATLRKARNARRFLLEARAALGHPIEVISACEEARIVYLGVAHTLADDPGPRLVVDIGGGSTECILGERFEPRKTASIQAGCVSYTLRFFPEGELRPESFCAAVSATRIEIAPLQRAFRPTDGVSTVGSSGTIKAIAKVLRVNEWSRNGITLDGLGRLREALIDAGEVRRISLPGLSADRATVLPGGLSILVGAFESLGIERMTASTAGLREGLLYADRSP